MSDSPKAFGVGILIQFEMALEAANQAKYSCAYYSNSQPFEKTTEAENLLRLSMNYLPAMIAYTKSCLEGEIAKGSLLDILDVLESLITAVEWETPAIVDGVEVEARARILMTRAREAKIALQKWRKT